MTPEVRERSIRRVTLWGALVNMGLTVFKIVAGVLGRSSAMVADGIHSLSDLLSDAVVLVFTHVSSKGRDKSHSFGHGKFETFATMVVSLMLLVVGVSMMSKGINSIIDILNSNPLPKPGWIAIVAAIISIASKEILYRATAEVGRKVDSPVVIANAWHHRSDALSSIGSLVGIGGAMLLGSTWTILDPLAACAISVAIIVVAVKMGLPSISELLEASLPEDIEYEIKETASAVPGVRNIHALKTRRNGISYIIDAHILVDPAISVVKAHQIASDVEDALSSKYGKETQVNIHIEPDNKKERMDI